ncbi:MAG: hypothetical protein WBD38_00055 [Candidatus Dormiibacterota bacterium]
MRAILEPLAWRRLWRYEESLRGRVWRDRGFADRKPPITLIEQLQQRDQPRDGARLSPTTSRVGLIGQAAPGQGTSSNLVARFYGLAVEGASGVEAADIWARATREAWPLVIADARDRPPHASGWTAAHRYVSRGGAILLQGLAASRAEDRREIEAALGTTLPRVHGISSPTSRASVATSRVDVAGELAGTVLEAQSSAFLDHTGGAEPIAAVRVDGHDQPLVTETRIGKGRLWITAWDGPAPAGMAAALAPEQLLGTLPLMMLMRELYGDSAYHASAPIANITIDDPLLRNNPLGMPYADVVEMASASNFHLTVATVPRDLPHADHDVVRLLARHPTRLTACYHGNDHDGYEFYSGPGRGRFRPRSRAAQERALAEAVARGRRFAARWDHALDRVMVFPHGVGPSWLLPQLGASGFLASCNWLDREPLGGAPDDDPQLGVRPADLAWEGFPLLWRRRPDDDGYVLDLFTGRPAITFTHLQATRGSLDLLAHRADKVNRAATRQVFWAGLEDVARHAYLQRRDPKTGDWMVLMTANEVCLHNPGDEPRHFRVNRPFLPRGMRLRAEGAPEADGDAIVLEVAPRGVATVRLGPTAPALVTPEPPHLGCSIAERQQAESVA